MALKGKQEERFGGGPLQISQPNALAAGFGFGWARLSAKSWVFWKVRELASELLSDLMLPGLWVPVGCYFV